MPAIDGTSSSLKSRLLSGGIWAFSAKAGTGFLTIALTALMARILDPAGVGVLFLYFSIVIMVSVVLRLGLDQLGIKLIGEALSSGCPSRAREITYKIIRIVLLAGILVSSAFYLYFEEIAALFHDGEEIHDGGFRLLAALWLLVTPLQLLFAELFRAYRRISHASIFSGGTLFGGFAVGIVTGVLILVFHFTGIQMSVNTVLLVIVSVTIGFLVLELGLIRRLSKRHEALPTEKENHAQVSYRDFLVQGLPFCITGISLLALIHMDTVILGLYRPEEEVAIYAASTRLVKLMVLSMIVAYEVAAPFIVELNAAGEKEKLETMLRTVAGMAALPALLAMVLFVLFPEKILALLYGEYYRSGAMILVILSIGQMINVWTGLSGYTLNMLGYQKLNMYVYATVTIVALLACLVFAERYGALAVATVISAAWAVQNILTVFLARCHTGIWTHASIVLVSKGASDVIRRLR